MLSPMEIQAQDYYREVLEFDSEGNLIMTTRDKIATGSLTYRTIGWTIKRYDGGIHESWNQCAFIPLTTLGESRVDPTNSAYKYSYFYCDKNTIFNAIGNVSKEWQNSLYVNGGTVYLDAIMTVCRNGVPDGAILDSKPTTTGTVHFTFDGIVNAAAWSDPSSLISHYGKQVQFPKNPVLLPADPTYSINHYEQLEGKTLPLTRLGKDVASTFSDFLTIPVADLSGKFYQFSSGTATIYYTDSTSDTLNLKPGSIPSISNGLHNIRKVTIFLYYKRVYTQTPYSLSLNYDEKTCTPAIDASGTISANKENDQFNPSIAIPTNNYLDINTYLDPYSFLVKYNHHQGQMTLSIQINTTYNLVWTDSSGSHSTTETLQETYHVDRPFSFYMLTSYDLYQLTNITVDQFALEKMWFIFENPADTPVIKQDSVFNTHFLLPSYSATLTVNGGTLTGTGHKPAFPRNRHQNLAESSIGSLQVKNDHFQVGETLVMNSAVSKASTIKPSLSAAPAFLDFTQEHILIPDFRYNKQNNPTTFTASFAKYGTNETYTHSYSGNSITIHTPIICSSQISDDKKKNQLHKPDKTKATLILGQNFSLKTSFSGTHITAPGYGKSDYSPYVKSLEVRLPFQAYNGDTRLKANTWYPIEALQTLYLPTGVTEGTYTIEVRALALNYNSSIHKVPDTEETTANLNPDHYIATSTLSVQVVGRMYDFGFTLKDGFHPVGSKDENGASNGTSSALTFPCNLNNAFDKALSFSLTTVGNSIAENDGIKIVPSFFHVSNDGSYRQPVKLYTLEKDQSLKLYNPTILLTPDDFTYAGSSSRNVYNRTRAKESVQKWSGTFTLPKPFVVLPNYGDLSILLEEKGSLSPKDSSFLQDGFLIVQFSIVSLRQNKTYLNYINSANARNGYCNMWKTEGFSYTKHINGTRFTLKDGDSLIFSLKEKRYQVFGIY